MKLANFQIGQKGRITAYLASSNSSYRQKLLAMGLVPGTQFEVLRVAPLGDPIELAIRDFVISLRKQESNILDVELLYAPY